ncbi:tRNA lysidine(34) synthetase TilS [Vibrio genomosp. F6 str. FF-238]|uniref:tRNA(Ile)-lysidine synthase n=2 Tax=Vibrio genomosp. F6 TaxID=723172 RepID=A0A1E5CYL3_9VIBR|nr:tRNA lysidine(34) synthetase TilS [Vibrio genomosp. F6 str. FF-238]
MCSSMFDTFTQSINQYRQSESKIILGLSGGMDSRVMLDLLAQFQRDNRDVECLAVHVHHGLSEHADEWAKKCVTWCGDNNIPVVVEKVQLDLNDGDSIEKQARDARYAVLSTHMSKHDLLLTGQHADDQLETFLLALKRGSGPRGLSCMAESMPFSQGQLLRPLLQVPRSVIESYIRTKELDWVEDESNQDTRYDRNFIRHQIAPSLLQRWPELRATVHRSAQLCAEQESLLDELLADRYSSLVDEFMGLDIKQLGKQSDRVRSRLIRMWFENMQQVMPSRHHLELIWKQVANAQQDANPILNLPHGQVRRYQNKLFFVEHVQDVSDWQHALELDKSLFLPDGLGEVSLIASRSTQLKARESLTEPPNLSFEKTAGITMQLTLPKGQESSCYVHFAPEGLVAHPEGRGHSRKLKKLFQEYGVPSWHRKRIPILMLDDQVVAVLGLFVDKHFSGQDCELVWDK